MSSSFQAASHAETAPLYSSTLPLSSNYIDEIEDWTEIPQERIADFPVKFYDLFKPYRYKVVHGGRGGLKSWNFARALLILGARNPLRILCARETMESIQQSVHQTLRDMIYKLGYEQFYKVENSRIIGINGTLFTFAGLAHNVMNIKSLEAYDIVWVEEAQTVSKLSWETLIPTFRKDNANIHGFPSQSEIWVSFNPMLTTDETYKRFVIQTPPNTFIVKTTYHDAGPWFPQVLRDDMEHLKRVDYETYLNVYEGEPLSNVKGAIFGEELQKARDEDRIGVVPYNPAYPVDTVWDLGHSDLTSIWFVQSYGGWKNFIDYLEGQKKDITFYTTELNKRGYNYGTDWLPFDGVDTIIHAKLAGHRGMSIEQMMRKVRKNVRIVPKVYIGDRINAGRLLMSTSRFDQIRCADGLMALDHYQWGTPDPKLSGGNELRPRQVYKREPLHDWASHAGEAYTRAGQCLISGDEIKPPEPMRKVAPFGFSGQNYTPFG